RRRRAPRFFLVESRGRFALVADAFASDPKHSHHDYSGLDPDLAIVPRQAGAGRFSSEYPAGGTSRATPRGNVPRRGASRNQRATYFYSSAGGWRRARRSAADGAVTGAHAGRDLLARPDTGHLTAGP